MPNSAQASSLSAYCSSRPSNAAGNAAPHSAVKRLICDALKMEMIPGQTGAVTPRFVPVPGLTERVVTDVPEAVATRDRLAAQQA